MTHCPATRATGAAALAVALSLGLAACGGGEDGSSSLSSSGSSSGSSTSGSSTGPAAASAAGTFGPGCSAVPTKGDGSFTAMAAVPVASAASTNPLLRMMAGAVGKAGLADTLNSAKALTVLAPTDDAFDEVPSAALDAILGDQQALTTMLRSHIIKGRLGPDQLVGTHRTLAGNLVTVDNSGRDFTVTGDGAKVLCGNIATANATVYVIDTVLTARG